MTPEVARRLADKLGLPPPALIRRGMHTVFRAGPALLRSADDAGSAARELRLLEFLRSRGLPVAEALDDVVHEVDGHVATVWRYVEHDPDADVPWEEVGAACARVHDLDLGSIESILGPLPSPVDFPWLQLDETIADLPEDQRMVLQPHWPRLESWRSDIRSRPHVVCHGDMHPGNVLTGRREWVLIDWDTVCLAPPEFDHAPLLTWSARWGGVPGTYERFALGFGRDLSSDPFTILLAEARNFAATVMLCRRALDDASRAAEAARRLRYWAGDPSAPQWTSQ